MDLGWMDAKLHTDGAAAVEVALDGVEGPVAAVMRRVVARGAHLLGPLEPAHARTDVLLSQLATAEELQPLVDAYAATLPALPRLRHRWLPEAHPALLRVLPDRRRWHSTVAVAPDGRWLLAHNEETARIWDMRSGAAFTGPDGETDLAVLNPGDEPGSWAAKAAAGVVVWFRAAVRGTLHAVVLGRSGDAASVAFDPAPRWVFTPDAAHDGGAVIWEPATGVTRQVRAGHTDWRVCIATAPDGTWLATNGPFHKVGIWDLATGTKRAELFDHTDRITRIAIAPDGTWLATTSDDDTVRIFDAATGACRAVLGGNTGWMETKVAIAPDSTWFATTSDNDTVRIFDTATGVARATLSGHHSEITGMAIAPDGTWLATSSRDCTVRIWDAATGETRAVLTGHVGWSDSVAVAPDGTWLASSGRDHTVRIWDTRSLVRDLPAPHHSDLAMTAHRGGVWLATRGPERVLHVLDAATGAVHVEIDDIEWRTPLAVAPDLTWLALLGNNCTIDIWDVAVGKNRAVLAGHSKTVLGIAVTPDDARVLTWSADGSVRVWDPGTGENVTTIRVSKITVHDAAMTSDGAWIAMACSDNQLRIREVATGKNVRILKGHTRDVTAVAFAPGGRWLATGSKDSTVRIWDARTGKASATLTGHTGRVLGVAVSPDGAWLASVATDATLRVWDAATGAPVAAMRADVPNSDLREPAVNLSRCAWLADGTGICATGNGLAYVYTFVPAAAPPVATPVPGAPVA